MPSSDELTGAISRLKAYLLSTSLDEAPYESHAVFRTIAGFQMAAVSLAGSILLYGGSQLFFWPELDLEPFSESERSELLAAGWSENFVEIVEALLGMADFTAQIAAVVLLVAVLSVVLLVTLVSLLFCIEEFWTAYNEVRHIDRV